MQYLSKTEERGNEIELRKKVDADQRQCDLRRPFCLRCLTDGHACEGYQRAATFVQHQPDVFKGSIRLKQTRSKPQSDSQSDRAVPAGVVLHPSLASSAFGQQCASFWWDAYVPKKDVIASQRYFTTPTPQQLWCDSWIDAITRMSTTSTVLRKALYALSLSCASCQRHDEKLVRQGLQYYSEALVELGQALQTPESVVEDGSLLPTCLLLADFEVSLEFQNQLDTTAQESNLILSSSTASTYQDSINGLAVGKFTWKGLLTCCK